MTSRRGFVLSLAGAAAFARPAAAQAGAIGEIRIDLSPLRARGWAGPSLSVVDSSLRRGLSSAFADRMGAGPTLVVRINAIQMSGFGGAPGRGNRGGAPAGQTDYMDGELLLVGRGGSIISQQPMLNALDPTNAPSWWSPDSDFARLANLASSYAYWARRRLG